MRRGPLDEVLQHLRWTAGICDTPALTDATLLERFVTTRDEAAFAMLVRRHGRLVQSVCRQILRHEQDTEDAFQATFLVFAARAASIRKAASVASWLYGAAYRTAMNAKRSRTRRGVEQSTAGGCSQEQPVTEAALRELQAMLAHEVSELPEAFRAPFVLCCLEGKSKAETARDLGLKKGTVSSRVARARKLLQERLGRRGVALTAALCAAELGWAAAPRPVFVNGTIHAALSFAADPAASGDLVSAEVAALARGVVQTMGATKVKIATALVLALTAVVGVGLAMGEAVGIGSPQGQDRPALKAPKEGKVLGKPRAAAAPEGAPDEDGKAGHTVVAGLVLAPNGKPLAGAAITVRWYTGGTGAPGVTGMSGPDGRFRLEFDRSAAGEAPRAPNPQLYHSAPLQVVASAKGYGPAWVHIQRGASGEDLTLKFTADDVPIRGRVLDLQLRPLMGATISAVHADGVPLDPWPGSGSVTTDKEGRFEITGVGRDRTVGLTVSAPSIERKTLKVSTAKASTAAVEVVAGPGRIVEGTVSADDTGKPLARVVVRGGSEGNHSEDIWAVTDDKGRYRLVGFSKAASYVATAWPGHGQPFIPKTQLVGDVQGLKPITADFRLLRGVALRVRLIDRGTGEPVRGMVHYDPLGNNPLREPVRQQRATKGGALLWQFPVAYPDKDGYSHLVALPGPGVVLGCGLDVPYRTRPLDAADAKAYPFLEKTPALQGGLHHYWDLFQSYRVFDAKADGKPLTLDIDLDAGRTAEGVLIDPDGKPLTGAVAFGLAHSPQATSHVSYRNDPAYRAAQERRALKTDRFSASGLAADETRTVTFLHEGRKLIANVAVRKDAKGPQTVRLERWGAVTGRLVDGEGKPLAGATVDLLYPSQAGPGQLEPGTAGVAPGLLPPGWPLRTDAQGRFRVEGLIPGLKHRIILSAGDGGAVTPLAPERLTGLAPRPGEVIDLGDIRVRVAPPTKGK